VVKRKLDVGKTDRKAKSPRNKIKQRKIKQKEKNKQISFSTKYIKNNI
tara:strand:+ start:12 stop:155 length:144 start_codon:yes stop_codon:yes gene_type:complete